VAKIVDSAQLFPPIGNATHNETALNFLLACAHWIDRCNHRIGHAATWAVLLAALISAGNAVSRYALDLSSNGWLEIQWYLFGATVMLGAATVLCHNEHVRVDLVYGRLPAKARAWIDLLGLLFFLLPFTLLVAYLAWPFFVDSWTQQEMSSNDGGLIRWPVKLAIPLGFALLSLQGVSEVIKRAAFLAGRYNMDTHYERPLQ